MKLEQQLEEEELRIWRESIKRRDPWYDGEILATHEAYVLKQLPASTLAEAAERDAEYEERLSNRRG